MTKKCSCCLRKSQGEMTRIGRPMKNTFKDLIQDFELPDGKICAPCHDHLMTFSAFKARIIRQHEKQTAKPHVFEKARPSKSEADVQKIVIKCEPFEMVPSGHMFSQFDDLPNAATIKTEVDNQDYDSRPLPEKESEDCKIPFHLKSENKKSESGSANALEEWNWVDLPPMEQVNTVMRRIDKQKRSKKYTKRTVKSLPRMPRCKGQNYECDLCGLEIKNKTQLKPHFVRNHQINTKEIIPCSFCIKKFYNRKSFIQHLNRDHADRNEFHCFHCSSMFSTMDLLREHRSLAHLKAQMGSKKELTRPKKKRTPEKVLCPQCGIIILRVSLKDHISKVHLKERKFLCTDCGKRFPGKTYLRYHIERHHSGGAKPYQCDRCSQRYPTKISIFKHLLLVHQDKKKVFTNKCEFCWKAFYTKAHLARHMQRMHTTGEEDDGFRANPETNMFHCMFCQRQFVGKMICKQHINKYHR